MTGSSAGALIGLMFVVITLVTGDERLKNQPPGQDGISTFSTPTVVHFSTALLISAVLSAPWPSLFGPAIFLGLFGLGGVAYMLRLISRTRQLDIYHPDMEDWTWYSILPLVSYATILAGAIMLLRVPPTALFVLAAGVVLFIFIGIRNAWDVVTFIATGGPDRQPPPTPPSPKPDK